MGRTIDEFMNEYDGECDVAEINDFVQRVSLGREMVFQALKAMESEYEFEIRVISDSQLEIEFFGINSPPILFITVDAPIPPQ